MLDFATKIEINIRNNLLKRLIFVHDFRAPLAPLVIIREFACFNGEKLWRNNYYPMELCYILDNQRVTGSQQDPKQVQV